MENLEKKSNGGLNENITPSGVVHFVLKDKDGNVKQDFSVQNMVVTAGKNFIADRIAGASPANRMGWMEVGTGTTDPATNQTLLISHIAGSRTACSPANGTVASNVITFACTFGAGVGTGNITEAGIFNIATANTATMLCRTKFSSINKGASDSLTITWAVTIS